MSDTSFTQLVFVFLSLRNNSNNFSSRIKILYFSSLFVVIERVTTVNSVIKKNRESPIIKERSSTRKKKERERERERN